jgi:hypothetical protein
MDGMDWQYIAVAAGLTLVALVWVYRLSSSSKKAESFGSGSNPWFAHIDKTPRCHQKTHHKLEHCWKYTGRGTKVVDGVSVDAVTGVPLTGSLYGRQTWEAVPRSGARTTAALDPEKYVFDPEANPVSGSWGIGWLTAP